MKKIPLSGRNGKDCYALVDDEDFPLLSRISWHLAPAGYAFNLRCHNMHSLIMGYPYVNHLHHVDHIDRNPLNNQKHNLRVVTIQQNIVNSGKMTKRKCTSKFKGVSRYYTTAKGEVRWMASITKTENGVQKQRNLYSFSTQEEAARAYDAKARELYGENAVLNFPEH